MVVWTFCGLGLLVCLLWSLVVCFNCVDLGHIVLVCWFGWVMFAIVFGDGWLFGLLRYVGCYVLFCCCGLGLVLVVFCTLFC